MVTESAAIKDACFDAETPVFCEENLLREIQYIEIGDLVLAKCDKTGEMAHKKVVAVFQHEGRPTVVVHFKNTPRVSQTPIEATVEHPFWVEGRGWTSVEALRPGDVIPTYDGDSIIVNFVKSTGRLNTVFDIEVEGFHTYFVGYAGLWFHTCHVGRSGIWVDNAQDCEVSQEDGSGKTATTNSDPAAAQHGALDIAAEIQRKTDEACFAGHTLVTVEGGMLREINTVLPGGLVLSRNAATGELGYRRVVERFERSGIPTVYVRFVREGSRSQTAIESTPEHPFYVQDEGWTPAGELQPGQKIETFDGAVVVVDRVEQTNDVAEVYDLEIEDFHTYFVGERRVWVHDTRSGFAKLTPEV